MVRYETYNYLDYEEYKYLDGDNLRLYEDVWMKIKG